MNPSPANPYRDLYTEDEVRRLVKREHLLTQTRRTIAQLDELRYSLYDRADGIEVEAVQMEIRKVTGALEGLCETLMKDPRKDKEGRV